MTVREVVTQVLADVAPDLSTKDKLAAERKIVKALVTAMVGEGFTLRMAADGLGIPPTTLKTWRSRDDGWAEDLDEAREHTRKWLLGMLIKHIEHEVEGQSLGGRGCGQAMNILSNLWFRELRETKVEATVINAAAPGASRERALRLVNKSAPIDEGDG